MGSHDGFVKIVSDAKYGEILGVHIIGPQATELIAEAVAVMTLEGTVDELMFTIHAHSPRSLSRCSTHSARSKAWPSTRKRSWIRGARRSSGSFKTRGKWPDSTAQSDDAGAGYSLYR